MSKEPEGRQLPEQTQFFSFDSTLVVDEKGNQSIFVEDKRLPEQKQAYKARATNLHLSSLSRGSFLKQQHQISMEGPTNVTEEKEGLEKVKEHFKVMGFQNSNVDESCLDDFQYFISKLPSESYHQHPQEYVGNASFVSDLSFLKEPRKTEMSPSNLLQKEKYLAQTHWMNQFQVECLVDYNGKRVQTVCCVKDAQLQFENGGCSFRLAKITKMKVLYENYQRVIIFTYDNLKGKSNSQFKFKILIENDVKDDLYLLFAKIVSEKLLLLDHHIDLKEGEDLDADKFMMSGDLFKKAQIKNEWKKRRVVISDRIESFKDNKMTFSMTHLKELWTRFQFHEKNLVVKIRHGKEKTELAIPLANYQVKFSKNNWMFRIYCLLTGS